MAEKKRPVWKCPQCGAGLVTARMWHSCGRCKLSELMARLDPEVKRAFRKLARVIRACGPVTVLPRETTVVFMIRVRFLAVYPRKRFLEVGIDGLGADRISFNVGVLPRSSARLCGDCRR